mmetsp:Transcript_2275/g.3160  ORF Transcript_2275/g.3160 Transcript_2275/m.3160 type:complete len:275 (+) Transcript_2275:91-915(+)
MNDSFPAFGDDSNRQNGKNSFPSFGSALPSDATKNDSFPDFNRDGDDAQQSIRNTKDRIVLKVIVLGTSNVGKTSLMKRYVAKTYSDLRRPTTGADFMTRQVMVDGEPALLQIWDTAGQERFHHGTLGHAFYRGADGALLVYDVSQGKSFGQIAEWHEELMTKVNPYEDMDENQKFPIVVVGNKIDLLQMNGIIHAANDEAIEGWCQSQGVGHVKTCAKDGTGVEMAMSAIAQLAMLNKKRKIEREKLNPTKKNVIDISAKFDANQNSGLCCFL